MKDCIISQCVIYVNVEALRILQLGLLCLPLLAEDIRNIVKLRHEDKCGMVKSYKPYE